MQSHPAPRYRSVAAIKPLALAVLFATGLASVTAHADVLFSYGFPAPKANLATDGWTLTGEGPDRGFDILTDTTYGSDTSSLLFYKKPSQTNAALFAASHAFTSTSFTNNTLSVTFDAGWRWAGPNETSSAFQVALLDASGNGYAFINRRTSAANSVGWAQVTSGNLVGLTYTLTSGVNTGQNGYGDSGGSTDGTALKPFTITRDTSGNWSFASTAWTGGSLSFNSTTTTSFSEITFFQDNVNTGNQEFWLTIDNVAVNATAIPEPSTWAMLVGSLAGVAVLAQRRRHAA